MLGARGFYFPVHIHTCYSLCLSYILGLCVSLLGLSSKVGGSQARTYHLTDLDQQPLPIVSFSVASVACFSHLLNVVLLLK